MAFNLFLQAKNNIIFVCTPANHVGSRKARVDGQMKVAKPWPLSAALRYHFGNDPVLTPSLGNIFASTGPTLGRLWFRTWVYQIHRQRAKHFPSSLQTRNRMRSKKKKTHAVQYSFGREALKCGVLRRRNLETRWGEGHVNAVALRGCLRGGGGGVLSPFLWYIVVDGLSHSLNEVGYYTRSYADNFVILITGLIWIHWWDSQDRSCDKYSSSVATTQDSQKTRRRLIESSSRGKTSAKVDAPLFRGKRPSSWKHNVGGSSRLLDV